jgi:hypothetical protein
VWSGTLLGDRLTIAGKGGQPTAKVLALVVGMIFGADSITDMDLLRHGGMAGCSPGCGRVGCRRHPHTQAHPVPALPDARLLAQTRIRE